MPIPSSDVAITDDYLTPEARARAENIDRLLREAGWVVQRVRDMNIGVARGVAIREFPTPSGPVDYLLYVDQKAIGTIEAKKEGVTLTSVEPQSKRYSDSFAEAAAAEGYPYWQLPLPFHYMSTGVETAFVDLRDPEPRPRDVFAFHRPETLASWARPGHFTANARCNSCRPLDPEGLRGAQVDALRGLEQSYAQNKPRALVHLTVGAGKTYVAVADSYRLLKHAWREADPLHRRPHATSESRHTTSSPTTCSRTTAGSSARSTTSSMLRSNTIDPAAAVVVTTLQRLYSILRQ